MMDENIETARIFTAMAMEKKVSPLLVRTASQTLYDAASMPELLPLIPGIWNVGGFAILAGDAGAGKSLFAMQEAIRIAHQRKILYLDFELSDKQFEDRYKNANIPDTFLYTKFDPAALDFNFDFSHIEQAINEHEVDLIVIDNITALSLRTTADADSAINVCRGLKRLQVQYGISSLIIAHVPKIADGTPLTLNHLAGSKHLSNFADNVSFVGKSMDGANIRYIKTVKNRDAEMPRIYAIQISNPGGHLQYRYLAHCEESDHLQPNARDILKDAAIEKRNDGKSFRQVQKELYFEHNEKVSPDTIRRWSTPTNGSDSQSDSQEIDF